MKEKEKEIRKKKLLPNLFFSSYPIHIFCTPLIAFAVGAKHV